MRLATIFSLRLLASLYHIYELRISHAELRSKRAVADTSSIEIATRHYHENRVAMPMKNDFISLIYIFADCRMTSRAARATASLSSSDFRHVVKVRAAFRLSPSIAPCRAPAIAIVDDGRPTILYLFFSAQSSSTCSARFFVSRDKA